MSEQLDWCKLPRGLEWLAVPAERYGHLQFDDPIYTFLQKSSLEERAVLREIRDRWSDSHAKIEKWLDEYPMTLHPEARLVYFTQYLLGTADDAGLL